MEKEIFDEHEEKQKVIFEKMSLLEFEGILKGNIEMGISIFECEKKKMSR